MEQTSHPTAVWPRTVSEAVGWLEAVLPEAELERIAAMAEDDLTGLHFEVGAYLRNRLGLWAGNNELKADAGAWHAVDVSMVVVKALWAQLHRPSTWRSAS